MKKCIFSLVLLLLSVTSLKVMSQTDSFFKYSNGMVEFRDEQCLYYGMVSVSPLTPEAVPLNGGAFVLLSCALMYFLRKDRWYGHD